MHNDSPLSAPQVWTLANSSLEDFKNAVASLDILPPRHSQNRWEAPPQDVFKVNVDGATYYKEFSLCVIPLSFAFLSM